MKLCIAILMLLVASPSYTEDSRWKWGKTDTTLQLTWTALHVLDWSQSRRIAREPRFYEGNPFLPDRPSKRQVDTFFAAGLVGNWAVAYALPKPYRRYWQVVSIGVTGYCVTINFKIGLGTGDWF